MTPKNFLFASMGSYGDLHPVLGVALELKNRGHAVTIASVDIYQEKIERAGLEFLELKPGLKDMGEESEWFPRAMHPLTGPRFVLRDVGFAYTKINYKNLYEAASEADVLIGQSLTFFIPVLAEKLHKPWASVILQPALFLSRFDPPTIAGLRGFTWFARKFPWLYLAGLRLLRWATHGWAKPLRELRSEAGVPVSTQHPLFEGQHSPHLSIAMFSSAFAKRQEDWPASVLLSGFAFYDADLSSELSPGLVDFLEAGEPPLVFTLGTAAVMNATDFYRVAVEASRATSQRAVLLIGRDARNREGLPAGDASIFISDYEPYSKLFPRARIVVHQGGVGTTAQALRSGRPQIIHPFSHDQPDNAERARRLGVSLTWPRSRRTGVVVALIEKILRDPTFETQAASLREKLKDEDGIKVVADRLEQLASVSTKPTPIS